MKRTFRLAGMAAMVLLLAASCAKEEKNNGEQQMITFGAGIVQNNGAKTGLTPTGNTNDGEDRFKQHWDATDVINVNNSTFAFKKFVDGTENKTAVFEGLGTPSDTYYAIYPANHENADVENGEMKASLSGSTASFTLPRVQNYAADSYVTNFAPMVAKATSGSTDLQFQNLCGLLELRLYTPTEFVCNVDHIVLQGMGTGVKLAGDYTCDLDGDKKLVSTGSTLGSEITMKCGGLEISHNVDHPTSFVFVLPPDVTMADGVKFTIYTKETPEEAYYITVLKLDGSENMTTAAGVTLYNSSPYKLVPDYAIGIISASAAGVYNSVNVKIKSVFNNSNYINASESGVVIYQGDIDKVPEYQSGSAYYHKCVEGKPNQEGETYTVSGLAAGTYYVRAYSLFQYYRDAEPLIVISGVRDGVPSSTLNDGVLDATVVDNPGGR